MAAPLAESARRCRDLPELSLLERRLDHVLSAARLIDRAWPGLLVLGLGAALSACSDSTGSVDQTYVTISSASPVVLRGDQVELTAALWTRTTPGDSVEVRNAELVWSTDDPTLASLTPGDNHTAVATGVNSGLVQIRAVATGFQGAMPATYSLRVSNPLEIDSMRPSVVRYGEKLTMYGVGVNTLFFASLQGATLLPDTFSIAAGAGGVGELSFWVPPPATSGHTVVLSPGQLVISPDSTTVLRRDLYEPNETAASLIDLAAPPFPSLPAVRFFNPALAFEARVRADSLGIDWYRFNGAVAGSDLTFIFTAPSFKGAHLTFLASPVAAPDLTAPPPWTIGSGLYYCKGAAFKAEERPSDSLVVALKAIPAGAMDLISLYAVTGRYGLAVIQGYYTTDPAIAADRFEENDNCEFADRNFADPLTKVDLSTPLSEALTIDNPHDVDWIRIHVPLPGLVTFRTASRAGAAAADDIDLYVMGIPSGGTPDPKGSSTTEGSSESVSVALLPGDYYVVVTDFAGTPTSYSICAARGPSCTLPPSPVVASASLQSRGAPRARRGAR